VSERSRLAVLLWPGKQGHVSPDVREIPAGSVYRSSFGEILTNGYLITNSYNITKGYIYTRQNPETNLDA